MCKRNKRSLVCPEGPYDCFRNRNHRTYNAISHLRYFFLPTDNLFQSKTRRPQYRANEPMSICKVSLLSRFWRKKCTISRLKNVCNTNIHGMGHICESRHWNQVNIIKEYLICLGNKSLKQDTSMPIALFKSKVMFSVLYSCTTSFLGVMKFSFLNALLESKSLPPSLWKKYYIPTPSHPMLSFLPC